MIETVLGGLSGVWTSMVWMCAAMGDGIVRIGAGSGELGKEKGGPHGRHVHTHDEQSQHYFTGLCGRGGFRTEPSAGPVERPANDGAWHRAGLRVAAVCGGPALEGDARRDDRHPDTVVMELRRQRPGDVGIVVVDGVGDWRV